MADDMTPPVKRYIVNGYEYDIDYADGSYCHVDDWPDGPLVKASDYDALAAQMAGLRADAERYRFIREWACRDEQPFIAVPTSPSHCDELIDAAMAATLPAPPAATTSEKE
jgi:hypothetical protein